MSKVGIALILIVLCMYGTASGQSLLDSVFGPSGLGVWGTPPAGQQFDDPRYYGGSVGADPNRQMVQPTEPGYPQGYNPQYPQQAYGYGQQPQTPPPQYYPPVPGQPTAPPPQYGPAPVQAAPQGAATMQRPASRSAAQPRAQRSTRQRAATSAPPQETGGKFGDPLPPGAVRITTTTPEGTIVQYYPPSAAAEGEQTYAQRPRPRAASSRAPRTEQQAAQAQPETGRASIAMPKPVPIPQGQDPRSGWTPNQ